MNKVMSGSRGPGRNGQLVHPRWLPRARRLQQSPAKLQPPPDASHGMAPGHPFRAVHSQGQSLPWGTQVPRHQLAAPLGWAGGSQPGSPIPQPSRAPRRLMGSPEATEESRVLPKNPVSCRRISPGFCQVLVAQTCFQTPENRLDESCIPNGRREGEGGGGDGCRFKAERDLRVSFNYKAAAAGARKPASKQRGKQLFGGCRCQAQRAAPSPVPGELRRWGRTRRVGPAVPRQPCHVCQGSCPSHRPA